MKLWRAPVEMPQPEISARALEGLDAREVRRNPFVPHSILSVRLLRMLLAQESAEALNLSRTAGLETPHANH